jgi:hypothetical protein
MPGYGPGGQPQQPGYPVSGEPSGGYSGPGYPAAGYAPAYPAQPQTESKAITGLILAIVSWFICPVVTAIVALVLASQSNRDIDASGGRLQGRGLNTATKWIAWANIVLVVIGLIITAIIIGWLAAQDPTFWEDLSNSTTEF